MSPNLATPEVSGAATKKARLLLANHASARLIVDSITATTITVKDITPLTGTSLYTASTPGMVEVIRGQDGALNGADAGLTANITGIAGAVLTVDVDYTTAGSAPALADGDIIAVIPPMSFRPKLQGGHTYNANSQNDKTKGLTDTFLLHNTPGTIDPDGGFTAFMTTDTMGFARMLAPLIGAYKLSGTVHSYVPVESDDGTYANAEELTVFSSDGDGVSDEVYLSQFVSSGTITFPDSGLPTVALQSMGAGAVREIGGSGKEYPAGANNWDRTGIPCDSDPLFSFTRTFIEFGGSFGDAITAGVDQAVTSATVNINKGNGRPRPLGNDGYSAKPVEVEFTTTINVTRTYVDDEHRERYWGQGGAPAKKIETRVLLQSYDPSDSTLYAKLDAPRCIVDVHEPTRNAQGLLVENLTIEVLHTLDATTNCIDTAVPYIKVDVDNNVSTDVLAAL